MAVGIAAALLFSHCSVEAMDAKPGLRCQASVQNKIGNLFGTDTTFLLDGNSVEIKQKERKVAKGIGFGFQIVGDSLVGRCFLYGGSRLKEVLGESQDKITLIDGTEVKGDICGIGKGELIVRREDGVIAVPMRRIDVVDSARCQDFVIPLTRRKSAVRDAQLIKIRARLNGKLSTWQEQRKADWFNPLISSLSTLRAPSATSKEQQPLICFAEDVDGDVMAVHVLRSLKVEVSDTVRKLINRQNRWKKLPPPPKPPGPNVQMPEERFWCAPRLTVHMIGNVIVDTSQFQPMPLNAWSLEIRQRFPQLPLCPRNTTTVPVKAIRPATGWTFKEVGASNDQLFSDFIKSNFDKIDANGDHFITRDEAARAVTNPDYKGLNATFVTALYDTINAVQEIHNDEWGDDNDGVTVADLTGLPPSESKAVVKVLSCYRQSINMGTTRDVFTSEGPTFNGVSQGYLNTCFFQAVAAGTASMSPSLIKSMIEEVGAFPVGERKFRVTMPGTGPIIVAEPTDAELSIYARGTANGIWMAILEKAYANAIAPPGIDVLPQEALQGGSSDDGGFRAILGGGFIAFDPSDVNAVHTALTNAFNTQHPVMFGRSGENIHSFNGSHLYAVTAYDPATQRVTIYHSLNSEGDNTVPFPVDHLGRPDDGLFCLALSDALTIFTHVQVSEKSVTEAIAVIETMKGTSEVAEAPPGHQPPEGTYVCYGKPPESDATPGGHSPPEGTYVCYGQLPESDKTPPPTGHNPPDGVFVCYGTAPIPDQDEESSGGVTGSDGGSGSDTDGHNPPAGVFVCYGSTPERIDAPPKYPAGHNPPPNTFVCYGNSPVPLPEDKDSDAPKKDASSTGHASYGDTPNALGFVFVAVCYDESLKSWVNIYGWPCPPPNLQPSSDSENKGNATETAQSEKNSNPPGPISKPSRGGRVQKVTAPLSAPEMQNSASGEVKDGSSDEQKPSEWKPSEWKLSEWNPSAGVPSQPAEEQDQTAIEPRLGVTYDINSKRKMWNPGYRHRANEDVSTSKEATSKQPGTTGGAEPTEAKSTDGEEPVTVAIVTPGGAITAASAPVTLLEEAQKNNQIEAGLECPEGGPNTLENFLTMKNVTPVTMNIEIGDWIFFVPVNNSSKQTMCKLPGTQVTIPPGVEHRRLIPTMCVSTKIEQPPGSRQEKVSYRVGPYPEAKVGAFLVQIIKTAEKLDREGAFAELKINPATRWKKVAQTSIWKYLGARTPSREDDITESVLKSDLLSGIGKSEKELSSQQRSNLDSMIKALGSAINKTLKQAE